MAIAKLARRAVLWGAGIVLVLLLVSGAILVLGITVDLSAMRPAAEGAASRALGREVRIAGKIRATPGLFSSVEVTDVSLGGEEPGTGSARLGLARLSVAALPLLRGEIHVDELRAENVEVTVADRPARALPPEDATGEPASVPGDDEPKGFFTLEEVVELTLKNVTLDMPHGSPLVERIVLELDTLEGDAKTDQSLALSGTGKLQEQPLSVSLTGGPLRSLLRLERTLPLEMKIEIGETALELTRGATDMTAQPGAGLEVAYGLSIAGERIDHLEPLIGVSLPPLGPYGIEGRLLITDTGSAIRGLRISVGESTLEGELSLDESATPEKLEASLSAAQLRLDDFDVGDWSAFAPDDAAEDARDAPGDAADTDTGAEPDDSAVRRALLDPSVMRTFDADVRIEVGEVSSAGRRWGAGSLAVTVEDGTLSLAPLSVELPGGAIALEARFEPLEQDGLAAAHLWPTRLRIEGGGLRVALERILADAAQAREGALIEYRLEAGGERLDSMNTFANVSLPPWGPYAAEGRLSAFEERFEIAGLSLSVGASRLRGEAALDLSETVPRYRIDLDAETFQLDDFEVGDWSPLAAEQASSQAEAAPGQDAPAEAAASEAGPAERSAGEGSAGEDTADVVASLLDRQSLERVNGTLGLKVGEVLSGEDRLGAGELGVTLEDARLTVEPLRVEVPGGQVALTARFEPGDTDFAAHLTAEIDELDYGVLARRIDPQAEQSGKVSVDIDIETRAQDAESVLDAATGRFDFAVWPGAFEADVFDLWAVNLFTAVNSSVDKKESESKVNCVVGVLDMDDGVMTSRRIFADTTRMQVEGEAQVRFDTGDVMVSAKPSPKRPEFFSAATRVEVAGRIEDFEVRPAPGALVGTAVRMVTSVVTTPIARLLTEPLPADGVAACAAAYDRETRAETPAS